MGIDITVMFKELLYPILDDFGRFGGHFDILVAIFDFEIWSEEVLSDFSTFLDPSFRYFSKWRLSIIKKMYFGGHFE